MKNQMKTCKACGKEIAKNAKICPHCGAKNSKPIYKKWWFWTIVAILFIGIVGGSSNTDNDTSDGTDTPETTVGSQQNNVSTNEKTNVFAGDCGISATAEMGTDIIGQPTVTVSITNVTDKDISAIKFYAVPLNVYGEELKGLWTQNYLNTDNTIASGKSEKLTYQFLEDDVKTIKLYVYSVYFSDGTEWGDREATKSVILKKGLEITVDGVSGQ